MSTPAASEAPRVASATRRWLVTATALLLAHLGLRAWALFGSFFYVDDYRLIAEARQQSLGARLLDPYDAQFMPVGRALAWVASRADVVSYPVLASMSLLMATAAAAACLWMLVSLFGPRPGVLAVLAIYLTTAVTVPATMWWAAGLNQLPLQTVFFVSVGAWVRHLRGEGRRWLAVLALALVVGLASYVKTLLVLPVLVFVALAHFATGGPWQRLRALAREQWAVALGLGIGSVGYLVYYLVTAPQIAEAQGSARPGPLAAQMVGSTFGSGLVGGPWRWDDAIAPALRADPPLTALVATWVMLIAGALWLAARRHATLRAWAMLGGYVAADYLLLLTTRAQVVGTVAGTEYRYLTDAACAAVLALALATMEVRGAVDPSRPRVAAPRGAAARGAAALEAVRRPAAALALAAVCIGGVVSTVAYARAWDTGNPAKRTLTTATDDLAALARSGPGESAVAGRVDLVEQILPTRVTGALDPRDSSTRNLLELLTDIARFPDVTETPHLLAPGGDVVMADVDPSAVSVPGPVAGCGYAVGATAPGRLALDRGLVDFGWWLRIDYFAGADSAMQVRAGRTTRVVDVRRGLHRVFVKAEGAIDEITLDDVDPGVTVCVDRVSVGQLAPAAR